MYQKRIASILFWALFVFLCIPLSSNSVSEKKKIQIYANQCDDDIRACFLKAIKSAKQSITLIVYSLNDPVIIKALNKKKESGCHINIVIDSKNKRDIKKIAQMVTLKEKSSALMHQKILIVDEEKIWIGSANFTESSLQMHDNLVVGICSSPIAKHLLEKKGGVFEVDHQKVELFYLPLEKKEAFAKVNELLNDAKEFIEIAMFTWTHPLLTQSVIEAKNRGINVFAVLDENNSKGTSRKTKEQLIKENINLKINNGSPLLHHKCCLIDKKILILGSTNWTKAAFSKNDECILIIYDLNKMQRRKMERLWHALRSTSI